MAFLVTREEKMKKNIKNSILFILAAAVVLLVLSVFLASAASPSAIDVKGTSTSQGQESTSVILKPQLSLMIMKMQWPALSMTTGQLAVLMQ